jgi:Dolichyl-phosphate-mannose-protein mannosyltransferase
VADNAVAVRRPRVWPALLTVVRAVPVWAWLAGIVVLSAAIRYALGRGIVAPWIMIDELIYSELAKSFAASGHFEIRGEASNVYGFVYPLLISPAWAVFTKVPQAYSAAKAINAVVMSAAVVPAYFLARRVVSHWYALLAAVLTVSVPSMLYTGMLMTENAFYPVFLLAALAVVVWLEQPSPRTTVLVLALSLLAFLTRTEAVALAPAILTAPLFVSGRRSLREYGLMYWIGGLGIAGLVVVQAIRGVSPLDVLGAYKVAGQASYTTSGVAHWFLWHVGELVLSLGVIPFAAFVLLALSARGRPRRERAFLAASAALSFWLVLEVAAFASEQTLRVEERNMFYVAPLFLIALLLWLERGLPRPAPVTAAAVVAAAALPAFVPYTRLIGLSAVSDTPALLPLASLHDSGVPLHDMRWLVLAAAVLAALLFTAVPARYALILPALVLAYFAVSQKPNDGRYRQAARGDLFQGITAPRVDWIDRRVGADAEVAAVWSGNSDKFTIWENEFFNRSVRRFYYTTEPLAGDLPEQQLTIARKTGLMRGTHGLVVNASYVLTDGTVDVAGTVIAQDPHKGIRLLQVGGPLRQISRVTGLYPQDTWSGPEVTYTRLSCSGGSLAVGLQGDPALFSRPQTVTAFVGGREVVRARVGQLAPAVLRVPLRPRDSTCTVRFRVTPTAVPAVVTKGANPDPRVLGVHFNTFTFRP